jgi:insulysin
LRADLSHGQSAEHRFRCGNLETLKVDGIREALIDFHKYYYSANIMKLVILGKEPIKKLEKWARRYFYEIPDKKITRPDLSLPVEPFDKDNLGQFIKYPSIKDSDDLEIVWYLPDTSRELKTNPAYYFVHLFGHEGKNSVLSYLKKAGLAQELYAGASNKLNGVYSEFKVTVQLTKKGLKNYIKVAEAIFSYAQHLQAVGPQEYIFTEIKDLGKLGFEFTDKISPVNYCVQLADLMQNYRDQPDSQLDDILRLMYGPIEFDK